MILKTMRMGVRMRMRMTFLNASKMAENFAAVEVLVLGVVVAELIEDVARKRWRKK
jgi:hypothetical protein